MLKRSLSLILALLMLFSLLPLNAFARSDGNEPNSLTQDESVESITLKIGEKRKLSYPGVTIKKAVSENKKVASVTSTGAVTAKGVGSTNIRLTTSNGETFCVAVKVIGKLSVTQTVLAPGKKVTVSLSGTTITGVEVYNENVVSATLSKGKGVITAKGAGKTTVHFYDTFGNDYLCTITVEAPIFANPEDTISVGQSMTMVLTGNSQKITWSVKSSSIAGISKTGVLTAKKAGTVTVTAKSATGYAVSREMTVLPTLKQSTLYAAVGDSVAVSILGGTKLASIEVANSGIAAPTAKGVTALAPGSTEVNVTDHKGNVMSCTLICEAPTIRQQELTIGQGRTHMMHVDGTQQSVKWSSSKSGVASISKEGILTAKSSGTAKITATVASGQKLTTTITVKPEISQSTMVLALGNSGKLTLNGTKVASVSSSDPAVATIDTKGVVKALAKGSTVLTMVGKNGNSYVCDLTVEDPFLETEYTVYLNRTQKLEIQDNTQSATWSTKSKNITVNALGVVSGKKLGSAAVTAKLASGKTLTTTVNVLETPTYTVTFNSMGGTQIDPVTVTEGDYIEAPAEPEWEDHLFTGWYKDKWLSEKYDFTKRVRSDLTLYAGWFEITDTAEEVITRGAWAQRLAQALDMDLNVDPADVHFYYGDTRYHDNGIAIETLAAYGLLPPVELEDVDQDIPMYHPDAPATREFVAYTAIHALGMDLTNVRVPAWPDASTITYGPEAALAVQNGILRLRGNAFAPKAGLTTDECTLAITAIGEMEIPSITQSYGEINLAPKAIQLREGIGYSVQNVGGGTYNVLIDKEPESLQIRSSNVVILPANEDHLAGMAFKVKSVKVLTDSVLIVGTQPKLEEVFTSIDVESAAEAMPKLATAAEGVTFRYSSASIIQSEGDPILEADYVENLGELPPENWSTEIPGKFELELHKVKFAGGELSGNVEITIPEVVWIADIDFIPLNVKEFTVGVTENIKIKEQLEYKWGESGWTTPNGRFVASRHEFFRFPFRMPNCPIFTFDLVFYCRFSAKGTITVEYAIETTQGYSYKNGNGRWIFDFHHSLTALEAKGAGSFTVGVAVDVCALEMFDLFGVSFEGGPALEISPLVIHNPIDGQPNTIICSDFSLYATLKAALDPDTAAAKFLKEKWHITIEKEFLKNDSNNPWRLNGHLENAKIVDECTFGNGDFHGRVVNAEDGSPIANALVRVFDQFGRLQKTMSTNSSGEYAVKDLKAGEYSVSISANGFKRYDMSVTIQAHFDRTMRDARMIRKEAGTGVVAIVVEDASTGYALVDYDYTIRKGWDNVTGNVVASGHGSSSRFEEELPVGNYTVQVKKDEYADAYCNVSVLDSATSSYTVSMSKLGQVETLRVILRWGATPRDLDSHMVGPMPNGGRFHTYYSHRDAYAANGETIANLDRDDIDSYGPETTTVYHPESTGLYSFYVHDYTNRSSNSSSQMSNSGAYVEVYLGSRFMGTYYIPTGRGGTVWHVFDFDPVTKQIIARDVFSYVYDPGSVGANGLGDTDENWEILMEDLRLLPEKDNSEEEESVAEETTEPEDLELPEPEQPEFAQPEQPEPEQSEPEQPEPAQSETEQSEPEDPEPSA